MQDCNISTALALEITATFTKSSISVLNILNSDLTTPAPSTAVDDETTAVPSLVHATSPTTSGVSTAAAGNLDDDKLPLMVGLGVAGGIILMLVLLLIALVCRQRRKQKSGVYCKYK